MSGRSHNRERLERENHRLEREGRQSRRASWFLLIVVFVVFVTLGRGDSKSAGTTRETSLPESTEIAAETAAAVQSTTEAAATVQETVETAEEAAAEEADTEDSAVPVQEEPDYDICLSSAMGPLFYYNQTDEKWSDYLWGGTDDLATYGCGPTTMAMIVNSFGSVSEQVTPITMADYCYEKGLFCQGHGSYHNIVKTVLTGFGFTVKSLQDSLSAESLVSALEKGHLVVALMGPGYFTDSGHYLIITAHNEDGTFSVADAKSLDNTLRTYNGNFLIENLHSARDSGAPLWEISLEPED